MPNLTTFFVSGSMGKGRRQAAEWDNFTVLSSDSAGKPERMRCNHCQWRGSAHATRLRLHFAKHHSSNAPQMTVQRFLAQPLTASQSTRAAHTLAKFQVKHAVSSRALDSNDFREFCRVLCPAFKVPCREVMCRRVTSLYEEVKGDVEDKWSKYGKVAPS